MADEICLKGERGKVFLNEALTKGKPDKMKWVLQMDFNVPW